MYERDKQRGQEPYEISTNRLMGDRLRKAGFTFVQYDQDAAARWDAWRRGGLAVVWGWDEDDDVEIVITPVPENDKVGIYEEVDRLYTPPIAILWKGTKKKFLAEFLPILEQY